jgi:hypothetical protein
MALSLRSYLLIKNCKGKVRKAGSATFALCLFDYQIIKVLVAVWLQPPTGAGGLGKFRRATS